MSGSIAKLVMMKLKRPRSSQGFTTVEVLVGLLLTVIFTGVSIQMVVAAAALRVRAQEATESATWVEADLAIVRRQSESLGGYNSTTKTYATVDSNRCNATTNATGYAALLQAQADNNTETGASDPAIGIDDTDPKSSVIGGRSYTLRRRTSPTGFHSLGVQYDIYRGTGTTTTPIYTYYTEVVPGVAFSCRQV